jgi:hypothetical protein
MSLYEKSNSHTRYAPPSCYSPIPIPIPIPIILIIIIIIIMILYEEKRRIRMNGKSSNDMAWYKETIPNPSQSTYTNSLLSLCKLAATLIYIYILCVSSLL